MYCILYMHVSQTSKQPRTNLESAVQSVLHDGNELRLTESSVSVLVEQLEHNMHHVTAESATRHCFGCPQKLL